ncbi:hypothetical protein CRG98_002762, partial [Punica granatum]
MAVPVNGSALSPTLLRPRPAKLCSCSSAVAGSRVLLLGRNKNVKWLTVPPLSKCPTFRVSSFREGDGEVFETTSSKDKPDGLDGVDNEIFQIKREMLNNGGNSFLVKLAIAIGLAAIITVISLVKQNTLGATLGFKVLAENSASQLVASPPASFSFKAFGYKVFIPEYAPGWVYFWLLMAAGSGLFISEEALNIW